MMEPASGIMAQAAELGMREFAAIAAIMQTETRIHLDASKRVLVQSRLGRRLRHCGLPDYSRYVALVKSDAEERERMVAALTTNHTHFFRESHHFDHLRTEVMPHLQRKAREGKPIRIWSAGCSSGEEPYTIAMALMGTDRSTAAWALSADLRILATDIADHALETARAAIYPQETALSVPPAYRKNWMRETADGFEVASEPRGMVTINRLNLFEPWPMRQTFDVIFCRNVMIYFDDNAKAELEARFVQQLSPGGYLYIGHSERLIGKGADQMRPVGHTIYIKDRSGTAV